VIIVAVPIVQGLLLYSGLIRFQHFCPSLASRSGYRDASATTNPSRFLGDHVAVMPLVVHLIIGRRQLQVRECPMRHEPEGGSESQREMSVESGDV